MTKDKFAIRIVYIRAGKMDPQEESKFFAFIEDIHKFLAYLKQSDYIVTLLKIYELKEMCLSDCGF